MTRLRSLFFVLGLAGTQAFTDPFASLVGTRTRPLMSKTSLETRAVEEFKMITEDEATVRKLAGVAIGVVTATLCATTDLSYSALSAGIFGSVSTFRTGLEYQ